MERDLERPVQIDAFAIDVGRVVERTVASLYSHLVTRPTGRAVRLAIEAQLAEVEGTALSVIDLSEVAVLDYSCADEVVAKLLLRYQAPDRPRDSFFLFRGLSEDHREPVQAVLERHELVAVAETEGGRCRLLGPAEEPVARAWRVIEEHGSVTHGELTRLFPGDADRRSLDAVWQRRLVFRRGDREEYHSLSRLARGLG